MARRSGPFSTVLAILFALPFVGGGGAALWVGFRELLAGNGVGAPAVIFGVIFGGAGLWQIRSALIGTRSAEARAVEQAAPKVEPMPVVRRQPVAGYRVAAGPEPAAREVYGAVLDSAPVPKIEARPGQVLAWALGVDKTAKSELLFTVIWNVFVWPFFFATLVSNSIAATLFSLVFVAVGVYLGYRVVHRFLGRRKLARVELGAEPVFLGSSADLFVEQRGPAKIIRYRVSLVCREEVKYTVGTDTRTEKHDVLERELLDEYGFHLGFAERWSRKLAIELPADAPASFAAKHNRVDWLIRVQAEIDGWPDYDEAFAFRALPRIAS